MLLSSKAFAQYPSGGGNFPEYKAAQIKSLTRQYVSFSDTTENDTTFRYKQEFDENGNMIQENFKCIYDSNCYYRYHYNEYGFLTAIDSIGFWGYGRGYGNGDTTFQTVTKDYRSTKHGRQVMKEVRIDHYSNQKHTSFFEYNSEGKVIKEITYGEVFKEKRTYIFVTKYTYNSGGLIISRASYSALSTEIMTEEHLVFKNIYSYEKHP